MFVFFSIQWLSRGTDDHADTCGIELTQYLSLSVTRMILLFKGLNCTLLRHDKACLVS